MQKVQLLDGGIGQEIFRRWGKPAHPLWSAKVMMEAPEIVKEVYKDFLRAGSRILTINTYTCTPTRLRRDGQYEWFIPLQKQACTLARQAVRELSLSAADVKVAGCLPPLVGSYVQDERSFDVLKSEYQEIVAVQSPRVDMFLIETISTLKEARAAVEAALESGKDVMIGLTLSDTDRGKLRSGESLTSALDGVGAYPLTAILLNCSFPETISEGMEILRGAHLPFGGYANGFTSVDALKPGGTVAELSARTDLDEQAYASFAIEWVKKGASIVGGCCEIGPSYIRHVRDLLLKEGYEIEVQTLNRKAS